uniref:Uncharacterized protein n=1 Tax=Plectus sambesii TaxID=2011161 RepID=A0A914XIK8_9BILA
MSLSVWSLLVVLPAVAFTAPIDSGVIVEGNNDPVGRLLSLSQVAYTFL